MTAGPPALGERAPGGFLGHFSVEFAVGLLCTAGWKGVIAPDGAAAAGSWPPSLRACAHSGVHMYCCFCISDIKLILKMCAKLSKERKTFKSVILKFL